MDNIKDLLSEINPEDWSIEGKKEIITAARVIDSMDNFFSAEEIEIFHDFFNENEWSPSIMARMLEKKIRIIENEPDEPNKKPLTLFASQRAWIDKINKSWDYAIS